MKARQLIWAAPAFLALASLAWGDDALTPIAAVVNQQTIAVVRIDLAGIDFDALEKWAKQSITQSPKLTAPEQAEILKNVHETLQATHEWAGQFTKAGGKTLWIGAANCKEGPKPPFMESPLYFIAVPRTPGVNVDAMKEVFGVAQTPPPVEQPPAAEAASTQPNVATTQEKVAATQENSGGPATTIPAEQAKEVKPFAQIGEVLVFYVNPMNAPALEGVAAAPRPDLAKALTAAGPGVVQGAFIPNAEARKKIEDSLGPTPEGQQASVLTRAISSVTFSLQGPPQMSGQLICQCPDKAAVTSLVNILRAYVAVGKDFVKSNPENDPGQLCQTTITLLDDWLNHVRLDGDKLVVDLDSAKLSVACPAMTKAMLQAQAAENQAVSKSHIDQVIQAMVIYTNGHNGAYPDSLEDLAKYLEKSGITVGDIMTNPANPDQKIGYAYIKPAASDQAPGVHVIVYEKQSGFGLGVTVGFVDGHIERITNEATFKKLLDAATKSGSGK